VKPARKPRTPRRRNLTKAKPRRRPAIKKEKLDKTQEKPHEKTPLKKKEPTLRKRKSNESIETPVTVKKARRASGHSSGAQSSVAVIGLEEAGVESSPGTSGLTMAEKNRVDARSSFGYLDATAKHGLLTIGQSQPGVWMTSPSNRDLSSPLSPGSNSFSPTDQQQSTVKKPRKQKIVAKDTGNTSTGSTFWDPNEDLMMISGPPLPNSLNSNTVACHSSPLAGRCDVCGKSDNSKGLVSCDKCKLEFHFSCLKPPLKYSPKRRGYSWFCCDCDETSSVEVYNGD